MITLEQAKALRTGTTIYSMINFNKKGDPQRWRVTRVITWKTRPAEVQVNCKYGLYDYDHFREYHLDIVTLHEEEARIVWHEKQRAALAYTLGASPLRPTAKALRTIRHHEEALERLRAALGEEMPAPQPAT